MPKFCLHDTIVLKTDPKFVGIVERNSHFEGEPLEECLIIAHTEVPPDIIDQFLATGTPPSGYCFVQFSSQEKGSSLVAESDLILTDRLFELGDVVKRDGHGGTGVVVNITNTYVLDPVWRPAFTATTFNAAPQDHASKDESGTCEQSCSPLNEHVEHTHYHRLISGVPFEELKRAQDFMEGDYIQTSDWIGVCDEVELTVIVKLSDNSIVAINDPEDLFIPIPDFGNKRFVSIPEHEPGIPRPDIVSAIKGWACVVPPEDIECGSFVVMNSPRLIRNGRWLHGTYDPSIKLEGHVLMVRCRRIGIQNWLLCNAFTPHTPWNFKRPTQAVPYENISLFTHPSELRRNRSVHLYDPGKRPSQLEDRRRADRKTVETISSQQSGINLSSNFSVGDQVKFRDQAGAAVKYAGNILHGVEHGKFDRIPNTDTMGYDLNEFRIVQSHQRSTVQWQDGSVSEHDSIELIKMNLFETDFTPGDIIVAREGMKQRLFDTVQPFRDQPLLDFNEMTYFEHPYDLLPERVGVVQSMNPKDKVVNVRWFQSPKIVIANNGHELEANSRFGLISSIFEDMSLYEIVSWPTLVRKLRDIVAIPPGYITPQSIEIFDEIDDDDTVDCRPVVQMLSQTEDRTSANLLSKLQIVAKYSIDQYPPLYTEATYKSHHSLDWVGEIVETRSDGLLVVRLNNHHDAAIDVLIEHDQILSFIDDHPIWNDMDFTVDPMDIDSDSDSVSSRIIGESDEEEAILEEVMYEGGRRLDHDGDDEDWESSDDDMASGDDSMHSKQPIATTTGVNSRFEQRPSTVATKEDAQPITVLSHSKLNIAAYIPEHEPLQFLSLERDPPPDQFRVDRSPDTSPAFLKRIAREHKILTNSLPTREIYVRTYDSRLDLLRCLIIGPKDTPYEHAPFLIDLHLGPAFPREPPAAHFYSWTSGLGRINPNLYEEGRICLSLLGTWPGKAESEGWTEKATILQLLVSLQGLVFVRAPFYNEAGFEGLETSKAYVNESLQYSEKAFIVARNFVKHALMSPVAGLEDVLAWNYLPKTDHGGQLAELFEDTSGLLKVIISRSKALVEKSTEAHSEDEILMVNGAGEDGPAASPFLTPLSRGALVMFVKTITKLEELFIDAVLQMSANAARKLSS